MACGSGQVFKPAATVQPAHEAIPLGAPLISSFIGAPFFYSAGGWSADTTTGLPMWIKSVLPPVQREVLRQRCKGGINTESYGTI
jgi:hypothetical protein